MILATLHETFAPPNNSRTFWVSCDSLDAAQSFKQNVLMQQASVIVPHCKEQAGMNTDDRIFPYRASTWTVTRLMWLIELAVRFVLRYPYLEWALS